MVTRAPPAARLASSSRRRTSSFALASATSFDADSRRSASYSFFNRLKRSLSMAFTSSPPPFNETPSFANAPAPPSAAARRTALNALAVSAKMLSATSRCSRSCTNTCCVSSSRASARAARSRASTPPPVRPFVRVTSYAPTPRARDPAGSFPSNAGSARAEGGDIPGWDVDATAPPRDARSSNCAPLPISRPFASARAGGYREKTRSGGARGHPG